MTRAGEILEVLSSDAAPYMEAQKGFEEGLGNRNGDCHVILLKVVREQGIKSLVSSHTECVVAVGTPAAVKLAGNLPAGVPLVFCMVAGSAGEQLGHVGATYGVTTDIALTEQFKLIEEGLPGARTLGMLYRASNPQSAGLVKSVKASLGVRWRVEAVAVDQFSSMADAINELAGRHPDVIWTSLGCGVFDGPTLHELLLTALRCNLPVFGFSASFVRAGALLGVNIDPEMQGKQAADIAARVMDHTWTGRDPPIQSATAFQIAVNEIVAQNLGISLPDEIVNRAAYVFKDDK